jgi:hypothetical protein
MIDQRLCEEFRDVGRDIFVGGMTSTHGSPEQGKDHIRRNIQIF